MASCEGTPTIKFDHAHCELLKNKLISSLKDDTTSVREVEVLNLLLQVQKKHLRAIADSGLGKTIGRLVKNKDPAVADLATKLKQTWRDFVAKTPEQTAAASPSSVDPMETTATGVASVEGGADEDAAADAAADNLIDGKLDESKDIASIHAKLRANYKSRWTGGVSGSEDDTTAVSDDSLAASTSGRKPCSNVRQTQPLFGMKLQTKTESKQDKNAQDEEEDQNEEEEQDEEGEQGSKQSTIDFQMGDIVETTDGKRGTVNVLGLHAGLFGPAVQVVFSNDRCKVVPVSKLKLASKRSLQNTNDLQSIPSKRIKHTSQRAGQSVPVIQTGAVPLAQPATTPAAADGTPASNPAPNSARDSASSKKRSSSVDAEPAATIRKTQKSASVSNLASTITVSGAGSALVNGTYHLRKSLPKDKNEAPDKGFPLYEHETHDWLYIARFSKTWWIGHYQPGTRDFYYSESTLKDPTAIDDWGALTGRHKAAQGKKPCPRIH